MHVLVTSSFHKDISKLRDKKLLLAIKTALQQIESSTAIVEIPNVKNWQVPPAILGCELETIAWGYIWRIIR